MSDDYKHNIKKQSTWKRGLYMLLFSIFYSIAEIVLFVIVIFQFVLKLLTGDTNLKLRQLGHNIGTYIFQIIQFLTFNSEYHPYPFGDWPNNETTVNTARTADNTDVDEVLKKIEQDIDVDGD